jgi:hypothetical protein
MQWVIANFSSITIRIYCSILSAIIVFYFAEIYIAYKTQFSVGTLDLDLKLGKRSNVSAAMQTNRMMPQPL